jgi:DNA repair protein RadC
MREQTAAYRITDLSSSERPRERLEHLGPAALTEAELLAILLRVGVEGENAVQLGTRLLQELGGLPGIQKASFTEVCQQRGVGPAKAAQIKAAIELGGRMSRAKPLVRDTIHSPADVFDRVGFEMSALDQEHLRVLDLDTRNRIIHEHNLYIGSLNSSTVRVAELFRSAIQRNAASIIIVHNHPSGDPSPSPEDVTLTRTVIQSGKLLDIPLLDHVVIGQGKFISMKEKGLAFSA